MGKATVVSGGAEGDYVIKLDYGKAQRDAVVKKINKRLDELAPEIDKAQSKRNEQQATEDAKQVAAETAIDDYVEATKALALAFEGVSAAQELVRAIASLTTTTPAEMAAAQAALTGAKAAYAAAQQEAKEKLDAQVEAAKELVEEKRKTGPLQLALDLLTSERAQLRKDQSYWAGLQLEATRQAWCADFTEDATGEVATLEILGESDTILIKPGAPAGNTVDGVLVAREVQTSAQVFWNAAVLPGWQKWKPMYRSGQIVAIDYDKNTADVALHEAKSSAQNLNVNPENTLLKDVPVQYMTCNAAAFDVHDNVVVRFDDMDWKKPKIIGFVTHPKMCSGGIGITIDYESQILRPPSNLTEGVWKQKSVDNLYGGAIYAMVGSDCFIDSSAGLCSGNKKASATPIIPTFETPLGGGRMFESSSIFISRGEVKRLEINGATVRTTGFKIKELPNGRLDYVNYLLPSITDRESWHMVSAMQNGSKFAVCRIKADPGSSMVFVDAVAHLVSDNATGSIALDSVQEFSSPAVIVVPNSEFYKAPAYCQYSASGSDDNTVEYCPWDFGPLPQYTDTVTRGYSDSSQFDGSKIYRAYIGHSGKFIVDSIHIVENSSCNSASSNMSSYGYWESYGGGWSNMSANCSKYKKISFGGSQDVITISSEVNFSSSETGSYSYDIDSNLTSYHTTTTTASASSSEEYVLLVDDQFSVVVTIHGSISYSFSSSNHLGVHATNNPEKESSSLGSMQATLKIIHGNQLTSDILDSSGFDYPSEKTKIDSVARSFVGLTNNRSYIRINQTDNINHSGFASQVPIRELLGSTVSDLIQSKLSNVMYAKDPRTGAGFLSFTWDGVTKNYVVGPWGVAPSDSRTDIAVDAKVSALMSV